MGLNGYQLVVRSGDRSAVEKAIRDYVAENGADASVAVQGDETSPTLADRTRRTFALSPPVDGTITVWEDGSWADRRMAQDISRRLGTEAIWLALSDVTDSWAYARYQQGEEKAREHREPDDVLADAERFARSEGLPFAFEYLEDPNQAARGQDFIEYLKAEGLWDEDPPVDAGDDGQEDGDDESGVVELDDDEADDDEADDTTSELSSVRGELHEFSVDV